MIAMLEREELAVTDQTTPAPRTETTDRIILHGTELAGPLSNGQYLVNVRRLPLPRGFLDRPRRFGPYELDWLTVDPAVAPEPDNFLVIVTARARYVRVIPADQVPTGCWVVGTIVRTVWSLQHDEPTPRVPSGC